MSTKENKDIARRWNVEIWNKGDLEAVDELCAVNFDFNYPPPGVTPDREGYKQFLTRNFATWGEIHCTIEDMVAEGDKVAVCWKWSGTHKGEFELMGIAPTGKRVMTTGISVMNIVSGKIVKEYTEMDMLSIILQLGFLSR